MKMWQKRIVGTQNREDCLPSGIKVGQYQRHMKKVFYETLQDYTSRGSWHVLSFMLQIRRTSLALVVYMLAAAKDSGTLQLVDSRAMRKIFLKTLQNTVS